MSSNPEYLHRTPVRPTGWLICLREFKPVEHRRQLDLPPLIVGVKQAAPERGPTLRARLAYQLQRLLAFSTIPYWGLGARIFPYAEERDDRFNLRVVNFGSVAAVVNIRKIWAGSYRSDRLHDFLADRVTIHCQEPTPLQIGGDVVGIRQTVRAELSTRPIRVVDYYAPPPV